ncbi:hypothetical protein Q3G72_018744 [Acer saccharum]|nr:hypothetical protein Q3G72_018744 [Acer saccharum]
MATGQDLLHHTIDRKLIAVHRFDFGFAAQNMFTPEEADKLVELAIFRTSSNEIKIFVVFGGGLTVWSTSLSGILSKLSFGEGNCC